MFCRGGVWFMARHHSGDYLYSPSATVKMVGPKTTAFLAVDIVRTTTDRPTAAELIDVNSARGGVPALVDVSSAAGVAKAASVTPNPGPP